MLEEQISTPEAQKLVFEILDLQELQTYRLLIDRLRASRGPEGLTELRIHGQKRFIIVFVYLSLKLDRIFPLSYHLERKGEPTPAQMKKVAEYEAEIRAEEKE